MSIALLHKQYEQNFTQVYIKIDIPWQIKVLNLLAHISVVFSIIPVDV